MRARHAASGFLGVIVAAAFVWAPVLLAKSVKAKMTERSGARGYGLVQTVADARAASTARAGEFEHSERRMHEPVAAEDEAPETEDAASASKPGSKQVAVAPGPKASARAATPTTTAEPANVPDVGSLRGALAMRLESLPICRRPGGPDGPGIAEVTFIGDGHVRIGLSAPYANTPVGACVARRLAVPAQTFDGEPVTMRVRFEL